jgi:hypothetical protein
MPIHSIKLIIARPKNGFVWRLYGLYLLWEALVVLSKCWNKTVSDNSYALYSVTASTNFLYFSMHILGVDSMSVGLPFTHHCSAHCSSWSVLSSFWRAYICTALQKYQQRAVYTQYINTNLYIHKLFVATVNIVCSHAPHKGDHKLLWILSSTSATFQLIKPYCSCLYWSACLPDILALFCLVQIDITAISTGNKSTLTARLAACETIK